MEYAISQYAMESVPMERTVLHARAMELVLHQPLVNAPESGQGTSVIFIHARELPTMTHWYATEDAERAKLMVLAHHVAQDGRMEAVTIVR